MIVRPTGLAAVALFTMFLSGCADEQSPPGPPVMGSVHDHDHDHEGHHHPETLAEAFAEVTELSGTISTAFSKNDPDLAHDPLHEIPAMLDALSDLAGESDLTEEAKGAINSNVKVLFDAFGAVDKKMHDRDSGKDYSEVSAEIETALKEIAKAAGPLAQAGEHDHDGDDHKDDHHKDEVHGESAAGEGGPTAAETTTDKDSDADDKKE